MNFKIDNNFFKQKVSISSPFHSAILQKSQFQNASVQTPTSTITFASSVKLPSWQTLGWGAAALIVAGVGLKLGLKKWRNVVSLSEAVEAPAAGFVAQKIQSLRNFISDPFGFKVENITSGYSKELKALHDTAEPSAEKILLLKKRNSKPIVAAQEVQKTQKSLRVGEVNIYFKKFFEFFENKHDDFAKYNNELEAFVTTEREKYYKNTYGNLSGFINDPAGQANGIIELQRILKVHKPVLDVITEQGESLPSLERSLILRKEILRQVADPNNQRLLKLDSLEQIQNASKIAQDKLKVVGSLDSKQIFIVPPRFADKPFELHSCLLDEAPPKLQNAASAIFGDLDVNAWLGPNNLYGIWKEKKKIYDVFKYV